MLRVILPGSYNETMIRSILQILLKNSGRLSDLPKVMQLAKSSGIWLSASGEESQLLTLLKHP